MSPSTETQLERRRQPAATAEAAAECGLLKGEKVRRDGGRDDKRLRTTKLQSFDEIPHYLQFNRYVREHYRPLADWQGCLRSLTYLHNETVNIFTHGKGRGFENIVAFGAAAAVSGAAANS